jgi:hypothetical protein
VPVDDPAGACPFPVAPVLPELPDTEGECNTDAPWNVVPWTDVFEPPPVGQDPIQTLPVGNLVYAFGDARRVALRAIDVRDATAPALDKIGRYDEPRVATGVAAGADRVMLVGPGGGLFVRDAQSLLAPSTEPVELAKTAIATVMLDDGRWVLGTESELWVEGEPTPLTLTEQIWSNGLSASGTAVAAPIASGAVLYDIDGASQSVLASGASAVLPQAIAMNGPDVFVAAPEWTHAIQAGPGAALPPHGVFGLDDVMDANRWRVGVPRRLLTPTASGLAEIATLGGKAGLALHGPTESSAALPPGTYVAADAQGNRLYLVAADRGSYRSQLVTVLLTSSGPAVASIEAFTGVASGVAVDGDRLYVSDADRGVRVYDASTDDAQLLGVIDLEVTP